MSRFIAEIQIDDLLQAPELLEVSGIITVEASVDCKCRKLDLYCHRRNSEKEKPNKRTAIKATVAKWEKWEAGGTYSYPFQLEIGKDVAGRDEDIGYAADWIFLPEIHIIGEFHPDTSVGWIPARDKPVGDGSIRQDQPVAEEDASVDFVEQFGYAEAAPESGEDDQTRDAVTMVTAEPASVLEETDSVLVDMMGEGHEAGTASRVFFIRIYFDRDDRRYRIGEQVTGGIFVRAFEDLDVDQLGLAFQWRTHGRAELKEGERHQIDVDEKTEWREGQIYNYLFRFVVEDGPETYRGGNQNLDWYVQPVLRTETDQVEADVLRENLEAAEEDFLLLPAQSSEMVAEMGELEPLASRIKLWKVDHPASHNWTWLISALVVSILGTTTFLVLWIRSGRPFLTFDTTGSNLTIEANPLCIGATVAGGVLLWAILNLSGYKLAEARLGDVAINITALSESNRIQTQVLFQPVREVRIDKVVARLTVQEKVTVEQGTGTQTKWTDLYRAVSIQEISEDALPDRPYVVTIKSEQIPENIPMSRVWGALDKDGEHEVVWTVGVRIVLKSWPDWDRSVPISVSRY